ncbi:uncharacterized, partial [Tachysurus ichikawai]
MQPFLPSPSSSCARESPSVQSVTIATWDEDFPHACVAFTGRPGCVLFSCR